MSDTVHPVPLDQIDEAALTRDRSVLDGAAFDELRRSIAAGGLRQPVELFPLTEACPPLRYGLLSGYRRLCAFRELHRHTSEDRYARIPAFIRARGTFAEALGAMVEENEIREPISPWERGRIALVARNRGVFGTIEEAVDSLFPRAERVKRSRLRSLARLVEELDGSLTEPETLSLRQAMRLSNAVRAGFGPVIRAALAESTLDDPESQWRLILPYLAEAEQPPPKAPARPGRPRRLHRPRPGLTIRRERTREGYSLHFTGKTATSGFLDTVFDEIERMFGPV